MKNHLKKKIYSLRKKIWLTIAVIALKINSHKLFAFILFFNIQKLKKIKCNNKKAKIILIFSKSGGTEDLIQSFENKRNNNFKVYFIPRSYLKVVHASYFKNKQKKDYYTKIKSKDELNKKEALINFLSLSFNFLDKFFKINALISFNVFYYSEKYLDQVCLNLGKKFLILHKESVLTPNGEKMWSEIYEKYNDRSLASKISVYSNSQKNILIKTKIAKSNQIVVNGCPRSDYSFSLKNFIPKKKVVVFFLFDTNIYSKNKSKKNHNWLKLYNQSISYLSEYAKKNLDTVIILKGKTGYHSKQSISKYLSKNCFFVEGGPGEKYLRDAKVVISFNSTTIFESIAARRNLIIPNFNNEKKNQRLDLMQIKDKNYYVDSKKIFFKKLDYYLKSTTPTKKLTNYDKHALNYYLGNIDGKSGRRMIKFLNKEI